ncbi:DUF2812 domain-containing protein [Paenibacillus gorillae]|uniref:DUF2812 domain-containing protein n=1 Tax=Paenibacillus gorillae TaxID=1243662 RepID=UPI0004B5B375|nr:DUF2812 domain-containing protein [Paenibacillus gorillae]
MSELKSQFKWWGGWEPDKIESWLEQREADGWQLVKVKGNGVRFQFQKGEPRKIRYCVDYQNKIDQAYISLFEEAGWELMYKGATNGWFIWRMAYEGDQRPEIYSDIDSLIERNKRFSTTLTVLLIIQFPILLANNSMVSRFPYVLIVYIVLCSFLFYGIMRINAANRRYKEQGGRFDDRT